MVNAPRHKTLGPRFTREEDEHGFDVFNETIYLRRNHDGVFVLRGEGDWYDEPLIATEQDLISLFAAAGYRLERIEEARRIE